MTGDAQPAPDTLRLRLAVTFMAIALTAIGLLAVLTVIFAANDVTALVARQRTDLTTAVAAAAGAAWDRHASWAGADPGPALDLAAGTGADTQLRAPDGAVVAQSAGFRAAAGSSEESAVIFAGGRPEGTATLRFTSTGFASADHALRNALRLAIGTSAGLAALLAVVTGGVVALQLARPLRRIVFVVRQREAGNRAARVGDLGGPTELRELGTSFDEMADTLDRHEQKRRDQVAGVAHELRAPVAVLQIGHQALLDGVTELSPEQLGSLRDEAFRLAAMIDDLQTLATSDATALQLENEPCDLGELAGEATASMADRFAAAAVSLRENLAAVPPPSLPARTAASW
jgi:two-component system sensor histidine kinase BaeS